MALHCKGDLAEMQAVAGAAGEMTGGCLARAKAALDQRPVAGMALEEASDRRCWRSSRMADDRTGTNPNAWRPRTGWPPRR